MNKSEPVELEITRGPENDTVPMRMASEAVEKYKNGERGVLATLPQQVRHIAKQLIEQAGIPTEEQKKLRRARTTTLILDPDPKVAAKGISLSQKETELEEGTKHEVQVYPGRPPIPPPNVKVDV